MKLSTFVTVIGAYGAGNLGDDVLMAAVLQLVRDVVSDDQICVRFFGNREYLCRLFPSIRFVPSHYDGVIASKLLLYGGGTQFFSFANTCTYTKPIWRRGLRYAFNPIKVYRRLFKSKRLPLEFERCAAISIGIGPFVPKSMEEKIAEANLKRCDWISVRDSASYEYCKGLGLNNVRLHADLCFAKQLWMSDTKNKEPRKSKIDSIGIIVRDWPHDNVGSSYIQPLLESVERLRSGRFSVRYISFAPMCDPVTLSLLNERHEEVLSWDPSTMCFDEFAEVLAGFDLLVTARGHGTIIGAALGIPSIAIEVEPKLRLISDQLRMGTEIWSPPFEPGDLVNKIESMSERWDKQCSAIVSGAISFAKDAIASGERLKDYIRSLL